MTLSLAIYTAGHGLDWRCPSQELSDLDQCRTEFGQLPDFDAGDVGFEGLSVRGGRFFVVRCFKAAKWDFKGRDSLYLAVTWMPIEAFGGVDVDTLLALPYFREPMRNPPPQFEFDVASGGKFWSGLPDVEVREGLVLRRKIGERQFLRVDVESASVEMEVKKSLPPPMDVPVCPEPKKASAWERKKVLWWALVGLLFMAVLVAFACDVLNRRGAQKDDGSGKNLDGTKSAESGEGTNGVSGGTVSHEKASR